MAGDSVAASLVLAAIWWAWTGYAWLTNALEPEEGRVRAGMFGAMAAMLVVALAVPGAFGADAVLFGVAYLFVLLLNLVLDAIAARRDPDLRRALLRFAPMATIGALCSSWWPVSSTAPRRRALWVVGLAVLYGGALIGRGRGWRISPGHFAERYGLIVIIALGESIIALGVGAAAFSLSAGIITAAVLGVVVVASLWWAYFDVIAVMSQRQLSQTSGARRARLARDYYSYLHLPMIAGIVLFALGLKATIEHVDEPLATVPAVALCGGLALYFLTHVGLRLRLGPLHPPHDGRATGMDRAGQARDRHRHAGAHPGGARAAGARLPGARDGGLLRADRLGCHPLPGGPRRGPKSATLRITAVPSPDRPRWKTLGVMDVQENAGRLPRALLRPGAVYLIGLPQHPTSTARSVRSSSQSISSSAKVRLSG